MTRVLLVADDLTGAADSAAPFVKRGFSTCLIFNPKIVLQDAEVVAFSSETRNLDPESAKASLRDFLPRLKGYQPDWLFCKIDSQLRGYPGVNLVEMMTGWGIDKVVIAPAFPGQGRTTRNGTQYIHGIPLLETSVGTEVGTSSVAEVFLRGSRLKAASLSLADVRLEQAQFNRFLADLSPACYVADSERDEDLTALVTAADQAGIRLLCGSAGLADALARRLQEEHSAIQSAQYVKIDAAKGDVIIVVSSYHPVARAQVEYLRGRGITVIEIPHDVLAGIIEPDETLDRIQWLRSTGQGCIVLTLPVFPILEGESPILAQGLAKVVKTACLEKPAQGLVLTGGDAAAAVCAEMDVSALRLGGEVQMGIPWGVVEGGVLPGLRVVTKSGGFGEKQALWDCYQFIINLSSG